MDAVEPIKEQLSEEKSFGIVPEIKIKGCHKEGDITIIDDLELINLNLTEHPKPICKIFGMDVIVGKEEDWEIYEENKFGRYKVTFDGHILDEDWCNGHDDKGITIFNPDFSNFDDLEKAIKRAKEMN